MRHAVLPRLRWGREHVVDRCPIAPYGTVRSWERVRHPTGPELAGHVLFVIVAVPPNRGPRPSPRPSISVPQQPLGRRPVMTNRDAPSGEGRPRTSTGSTTTTDDARLAPFRDGTYLDGTGIWDLVLRRAEATPGTQLVVDETRRRMTFGEYRDAAERVAAGLAERGVRAGDVVSWQLPSRIDTMVLLAALSRLGAVQNPLIMMLREPDVEFICRQAGSRFLIVPEEFRGYGHGAMADALALRQEGLRVVRTDGGLPEADPVGLPEAEHPGVGWLFYTSGTTSAPKGARHVDAGLLAAARTFCTAVEPEGDDVVASLAPMAHVGGVLHVVAALMTGARLVISATYSPAETAQLLSEERVTLGGSGVPFIRGLLQEQRAAAPTRLFPEARAWLVGGASRTEALHREVRDELGGVGVVSGYGLTECPFVSWGRLDDGDHEHATADGRPGPGTHVRIVAGDGREKPAGEPGELRVKADQLMLGYVDGALDAEAFDERGYFRTGDLAVLDERRFLTITGRIKDVIIRNMENIPAREVEMHLATHPDLADVAVIGLPDERTGERVCAVAVVADGRSGPTLQEVCGQLSQRGLNTRKLPEQLEFVEELPRNAMGKVVKTALRTRFASGTRAGGEHA
ncbi:class I adenylate-forming enzyme family protein [Streptomyces sulphureus]|uniref:class I adenylate-forming enzyme family protein n=1 Tax=Streptomyces sulphureus TaxID=47758 RepID=UPI001B7F7A30|nr:AMP-binding protein [Streptomyces sulphureus]